MNKNERKNIIFLDTNMVVSNSELEDSRYNNISFSTENFFLPEKFKEEVEILLSNPGYRRINTSEFTTISFDQIRDISPEMCPVYYNFLIQMNNPAVVDSPNFFHSILESKMLKNKKLSKEEQKIMNLVSDKTKERNNAINEMFSKYGVEWEDNSELRFLKKKRTAIKKSDPNYFNDIRSISLMLIYCLLKKKSATLLTSDVDLVELFFNLTESISAQSALKFTILPLLTDKHHKIISSGSKAEFTIDVKDLTEKRVSIMHDIYSHRENKTDIILFEIKYWSIKEQRYYNYQFYFSEDTRTLFLKSHGALNCLPARNAEYGNWLKFEYFWPPANIDEFKAMKMKVFVFKKPTVNYENREFSNTIHNSNCLYIEEDKKNNYAFFSDFK